MSRTIRRTLLVLLLATGLTSLAQAGFVNNALTGCCGPLVTAGAPKIGTSFTVTSPCPPPSGPCFLFVGQPLPFCVSVPPLCAGCSLCCDGSLMILAANAAGSVTVAVPNAAALIGASGCMQMVCFDPVTGCWRSSDSLTWTIE